MVHHIQTAQFALCVALFLGLAGMGAAALARERPWAAIPRADLLALSGCVLVALVLRASATTFPADMVVAAQGDMHQCSKWSAGFSAFRHMLYVVFPPTVSTMAAANVLIGSATVIAAWAFTRELFGGRAAPLLTALVFATQPVSVRHAASDTAHVLLTLSLFLAFFLITLWSRRGSVSYLVQAAGWTAVAANLRVEGLVMATAAAPIFLGVVSTLDRRAVKQIALACLVGGIACAYPLFSVLWWSSDADSSLTSPFGLFEAFFLSEHSPALIAVAGLVGFLWAGWVRPRRALALLAAIFFVALPTGTVLAHGADYHLRYVVPSLALWAVFAGQGLALLPRYVPRAFRGEGRFARARPLVTAAAALLVLLSWIPHREMLTRDWTHALEYEFFISHLDVVPEGCLLVVPDGDYQHRGLRVTSALPGKDRGSRWLPISQLDEAPDGACKVLYRAAACFAWEMGFKDWEGPERPECLDARAGHLAKPLATRELPAVSYGSEYYSADPIWVGFYLLEPAVGGEAAALGGGETTTSP